MKNVGIFGGTFNPIHQGHIGIAEEVRRAIPLDEILFIPSGDPPQKNIHEVVSAHHRLEMVRLGIEGVPHFRVSDIEVIRQGKSYTLETVESLKRDCRSGDQLFLILGIDAFQDLPTWHKADQLISLCHFIVVSRPDYRFQDLEALPYLGGDEREALDRMDKNLSPREDVSLTPSTRLIFLRVRRIEASATKIRDGLSDGHPWTKLLPPKVESYIMQHRLYAGFKGTH